VREGFVIPGVFSRFVAYAIDSLLVAAVPAIISLFLTDFDSVFRQLETSNGTITRTVSSMTPLENALLALVGVGISFLYFVGLWTTNGRATLGMRLLSMQVADAMTGETLTLVAAVRRWVALGGPLPLLGMIPALGGLGALLGFALSLVLLITTATDPRHQGLHDRFAGSLFVRRATSGDGATFVGCLVLIGIVGIFILLFSAFALSAMGPYLQDIIDNARNAN
jgi:uncharacterized RDD family membrane protein YckC